MAATIATPAPPAPAPAPPRGPAVGRLSLDALLDTDPRGPTSALDPGPALLVVARRPASAPASPGPVPFEDERALERERLRRLALVAASCLGSAIATGLSLAAALG